MWGFFISKQFQEINMSEQDFVNEKEHAKIRKCSVSTLRQERHRGTGPAYYKINRLVLYKKTEILDFIENCKIETQG